MNKILTVLIIIGVSLFLTGPVCAQVKKASAEDSKTYFQRAQDSSPGNCEQAIKDFTRAIELEPNFTEAYYSRGICFGFSFKYEEAIKDFTKAIELNPVASVTYDPYRYRGVNYYAQKKFSEALEDYMKSINHNPDDPLTYESRANTLMKLKRYDEAIKDYDKYLQFCTKCSWAFKFRGDAHFLNGNYVKALNDLNQAIQINPKEIFFYINRAGIYRKMGKIKLAQADDLKIKQLDQ